MPLQPPILDDRSFAELHDELVARIPVFTPEWTDHHPSDPGITLLDLFAFLGEQLLFRFNQIPDTTKVAFLNLLDIPLRPAIAATGLVRFETDVAAGVLVDQGSRLLAGEIPFQTKFETRAWPLAARAAIRAEFTGTLDAGMQDYLSRASAAIGSAIQQVSEYQTRFGAFEPTKPGGDTLDPKHSVDETLYIALTGDQSLDLSAMADNLLTIGIAPADDVPSMAQRQPCPGEGFADSTPAMQWQISTTRIPPNTTPDTVPDPIWLDLDVVGDTTGGLSYPGSVRLEMPDSLEEVGVYIPPDPDAMGAGDQPPLVEDEEIAAELVAWLRVFRPDGSHLPAIDWVGTNAVMAEQSLNATLELLGTGTGEPGQELRLINRNVLGTVRVEVDEAGGGRWMSWDQVDSLRGSGIGDRHFTLDPEAGVVACGDGRRGRIWQIGERVRVRSYRYGGGVAGNVAAAAVVMIPGVPRVSVSNPLEMRGGADMESLPGALARIPEEFRRHDRAVTVSDYRELAEATPGAGVGRAETLRLFHPKRPNQTVPGAISVLIWPRHDPKHPNAPMPDRTMLDAVCRYLDARRLVTTEVHVIPPTYRRIAVSIGIAVKPGYGIEAARRWAELIVRQYLAPLPPFGPEGRGWPLGRAVYGPELEAAALQVEGVEYVEDLRIAEQTSAGWVERPTRRITLEKWEMPELAEITVISGLPLDPGIAPEPPPLPGLPVPVRTPRNVC